MLHCTRDETYWSSVLNSEIWQLGDENQKFLAVLKLSYDALPSRSKKCFAFGSLLPKSRVMNKDELIQLWTANGFVCSEGNFDAETVGNRIFDDLVLRSFFLLATSQKWYDGSHVTAECTMHDLMHDLARSISEDEYCNRQDCLFKDMQKRLLQARGLGLTRSGRERRTYHLCIEYEEFSDISLLKKSTYLRTLSLRNCLLYKNVHLLQFIFSELKFLRALDLSENGIKGVPTSVGNLIHLRYLTLSKNKIKFLPDTITLLQNLLFLNLTENPLQELPKRLRYMQSLWYLYCDCDSLTHMPPGLSGLTSLRSLSSFVVENRTGSCSITQLEDLKLHGAMEIKFSKNFSSYSCGGRKIFMNKDFNELSLSFNCSTTNDMSMLDDLCPNTSLKKLKICNYGSRQFPTWLMESQLPNLVEVILHGCNFCEHIPQFGDLQFLRKLVIDRMGGVKHMGDEFHGHGPTTGFPNLQELVLKSMTNLDEWSESDDVNELFPLLKRLEICNCPRLKNMPRLPTIEFLKLQNCSESLLSCVGRTTSLSHLILEDMEGMTSLPSGCLRNLTSLMTLEIRSCNELQFLPREEMQLLTMVRSLSIKECNNLASFPLEVGRLNILRYFCFKNHGSNTLQLEILVKILNSVHEFDIQICGQNVNLLGQLQHLHNLRQLWISGSHHFSYALISGSIEAKLSICCCNELESLMTEAPSTSTVLEDLHICNIPNLTTLPEWLQHLGSLRKLSIHNCIQLGSLPRGLQDLSLLKYLFIEECCLQLQRRCTRATGEDWPNIFHVPHIRIFPRVRVIEEAQCCGLFDRFFPTRSRDT
ncbi:putative disease resistance protein RGA3 [Zingiber officinale]|uniref:putative disease resistance protein RGA3 n=1 Tax=Zingiber officinale TaxID=94328 RepID=UPI001C4BA0C2|nr:putative disease resistance protein RGA3 [Zingiber officinale]